VVVGLVFRAGTTLKEQRNCRQSTVGPFVFDARENGARLLGHDKGKLSPLLLFHFKLRNYQDPSYPNLKPNLKMMLNLFLVVLEYIEDYIMLI
jgi:hypothetical protein